MLELYSVTMHLDGLVEIEQYVVQPMTELTDSSMRKGWTRLTMPIHVALTLVRATSCQGLRGISSFFIGGLTGDLHGHVLNGLNDYASIIVQVGALPIVGVVSMVSPTRGLALSKEITLKYDCVRSEKSECIRVLPASSRYQRIVESFFKGVVGVPNSVVFSLTLGGQNLLLGEYKKAALSIPYAAIAPIWSLISAFAGGFVEHNYNFALLMNRCEVEAVKSKLLRKNS